MLKPDNRLLAGLKKARAKREKREADEKAMRERLATGGLLTKVDVAMLLSVSKSSVERLVRTRGLIPVRLSSQCVRFRLEDVKRLILRSL